MAVLLLCLAPEEVEPPVLSEIESLAPAMRVVLTRERAEIEALLHEVEVAVGHMPLDLISRAARLRWFQQWGAGADWLLEYPEAAQQDFVLTNTSGLHAIPISEQIIGMLLMFARGLHQAVRAQERREWWRPESSELFELAGKTMLLVGVGAIGQRTALLATALGMRVEGIRRDPTCSVDGVDAMYGPERLHDRLASADVVVLTVPLSEATRGLIGERELRGMKPTAYLINIGRGGTVDEAALARALDERWIAGVALDVFEEEPLRAASPLWRMENVILTGHYAGATPHYHERAMAIFLDNLRRFSAGMPLRNQVDKRAGY